MSKRGLAFSLKSIFILLSVILFISLASAQFDNSTVVGAAQQCIMNKVSDDCSKLLPEQIPFAIMGIGDYENCAEALNASSRIPKEGQQCWPLANCKIKDTAIAILALYQLGEDTTAAENWLLNQTMIASDLEWYLQITADEPASCALKYGANSYNINILEDDKLSGTVSGCLSIDSAGYWLRISSDETCISQQYKISCDKTFRTNLIYKTSTSPAIHVSQKTHEENAGAETIEEITYKCFKQLDKCTYEGTLWAATVLQFTGGVGSADFLPYLIAGVDENSDMFPETFLYKLDLEEYRQPIVDGFNEQFWGTGSDRFYKTALALFALTAGDAEVEQTKNYLSGEGIQGVDGCWGNIIDTGFLLYAGWPEEVLTYYGTGDGDGETLSCIENNYFCKQEQKCLDAGGLIYNQYKCSGGFVCCSVDVKSPSCISQGGTICPTGYECPSGSSIPSLETEQDYRDVCCAVECEEAAPLSECELNAGICRSSCNTATEQSSYYDCTEYGDVCCVSKTDAAGCATDADCDEGEKCASGTCVTKKSYWWIWLLVILIIIVILAIIFRKRIQMMVFKRKAGVKKGPAPKPTQPPTFPPRPPMLGLPAHPGPRQARPVFPQPSRKPTPSRQVKDKDFEETLKKLKEMSK